MSAFLFILAILGLCSHLVSCAGAGAGGPKFTDSVTLTAQSSVVTVGSFNEILLTVAPPSIPSLVYSNGTFLQSRNCVQESMGPEPPVLCNSTTPGAVYDFGLTIRFLSANSAPYHPEQNPKFLVTLSDDSFHIVSCDDRNCSTTFNVTAVDSAYVSNPGALIESQKPVLFAQFFPPIDIIMFQGATDLYVVNNPTTAPGPPPPDPREKVIAGTYKSFGLTTNGSQIFFTYINSTHRTVARCETNPPPGPPSDLCNTYVSRDIDLGDPAGGFTTNPEQQVRMFIRYPFLKMLFGSQSMAMATYNINDFGTATPPDIAPFDFWKSGSDLTDPFAYILEDNNTYLFWSGEPSPRYHLVACSGSSLCSSRSIYNLPYESQMNSPRIQVANTNDSVSPIFVILMIQSATEVQIHSLSTAPTGCEPGYRGQWGICEPCPTGTFNLCGTSTRVCHACPENAFCREGATIIDCKTGYYLEVTDDTMQCGVNCGDSEFFVPCPKYQFKCSPCSNLQTCAGGIEAPTCNPGSFPDVSKELTKFKPEIFMGSNSTTVFDCSECPENGLCTGGDSTPGCDIGYYISEKEGVPAPPGLKAYPQFECKNCSEGFKCPGGRFPPECDKVICFNSDNEEICSTQQVCDAFNAKNNEDAGLDGLFIGASISLFAGFIGISFQFDYRRHKKPKID